MKRLMLILVVAAGLAVAAVPQRYTGDWFAGNTSDLKLLPPQTLQKNEFSFLRMIYNGRTQWTEGVSYGNYPIKNWYTDYPEGDGDVNLVKVYRRLSRADRYRPKETVTEI